MTTETDDLNYYETELPKIIAGVRRGEKWEWKSGDTWISGDDLPNFLRHHSSVRVRLAPVPVVKTLSPEDILEMKRMAECLTEILKRYE